MRKFTIEARTRASAAEIMHALASFGPELVESRGVLCVEVLLGDDQGTITLLNAVEAFVIARGDGPARVDLDGTGYLIERR